MPLIEVLEDDPPSQNYITEKTVDMLVDKPENESTKSTSLQIQDITETSEKVHNDSETLDNKKNSNGKFSFTLLYSDLF